MRQLAILVLSVSALAATGDLASARDGCGAGRYYNGYRCVPMVEYGPRPYEYVQRPYYGNQNLGNGMYRDRNGALQCVQRGFTVQDGQCKPYRGF